MRTRRNRLIGGVAILVACGLMVAAVIDRHSSSVATEQARVAVTPSPLVPPRPAPSIRPSTVSPVPKPSVRRTSPSPTRPRVGSVPASSPVRMEIPAVRFDQKLGATSLIGGTVDPPVLNRADWLTDRGVAPGSSTHDRTYIAGHTCRKCTAAFNAVDTSVQIRDVIYLTTRSSAARGVKLRYIVTSLNVYDKGSDFRNSAEVQQAVGNTLVLITCNLRDDGRKQTQNKVITATYQGLVLE